MMVQRTTPTEYFGVVEEQGYVTPTTTTPNNARTVNNYYSTPLEDNLTGEELIKIKYLIIGLGVGLAVGMAFAVILRKR